MENVELTRKVDILSSELTAILPDFKLLEANVPLFDSNYKYFSVIYRELKEVILKEINKNLEPIKFDIHKLTDSLENSKGMNKSSFKEHEHAIETLKSRVENLTHDTNSTIREIDVIKDGLEQQREDILSRVTYPEFNVLGMNVETKASRSLLTETEEFLSQEIQKRVQIPDFEQLIAAVTQIQEDSKLLASIELVQNNDQAERLYVDNCLKAYVTTEDFKYYKEDVKFELSNLNEKIERTETIQGFTNDAIRKELAALNRSVKKRPWRKDIEIFKMNLQEAAKIIELQKHKENIIENLDEFKGVLTQFGGRCDNYEKVLARFDEILLEKAAKDDISQINKFLPTLAKKLELANFQSEIGSTIESIQEKLEATLDQFSKNEVVMGSINTAFRSFKSDNKDNIQIKNSILDLQSVLESKAEKVDVLSVSENIVKKEEFIATRNACDMLRRQMEMEISIVHAVMRTMIKSTDSAMTKNKQRLELLRNMGNLMNWVGVVGNNESTGYLPTMHSGVLQKSHPEFDPSMLLPSIKHPRKSSQGDMELSKFKGKYDI